MEAITFSSKEVGKRKIVNASEYTSFSDKNFLNEAEFRTLSFSKLNIFLAIVNFVASDAS